MELLNPVEADFEADISEQDIGTADNEEETPEETTEEKTQNVLRS